MTKSDAHSEAIRHRVRWFDVQKQQIGVGFQPRQTVCEEQAEQMQVRRKRSKPQECPDRTSDDVGYISGVLAKDHRGG